MSLDRRTSRPSSHDSACTPLLFGGGGYLLFNGLFALIPIIRNLESALARQKRARKAKEATD